MTRGPQRARRAALHARTLLAARVSRRLRGAVILLYHRVDSLALDPQRLAVSPDHFNAHMALLAAEYHPVPLEELADAVRRRGGLPERAVAVTFDDGYADNLLQAKPILSRHGVPATVFVTTGHTGTGREFWWDELERLLLLPGPRPADLQLKHDGRPHRWPTASEDERRSAYDQIQPLLRFGSTDGIESALRTIRTWAGEPESGAHRASHRAMTAEEIRILTADGLVDVGPHTRRHAGLAAQPADVQRDEIAGSRADLEAIVGRPTKIFSYPFGGRHVDYTVATVQLVREIGFPSATANFPGRVTRLSGPRELPRHLVRDWDASTFERWLAARFAE